MSGEENRIKEKCAHQECQRNQRIWLPETIDSQKETRHISSTSKSDIFLHNWCIHCGCIQNRSDDRPKKIGYWINILSEIGRYHFLTECQKRLIIKELESSEFFEDMYVVTGSAQQKIFTRILQHYSRLGQNTIDSFIF